MTTNGRTIWGRHPAILALCAGLVVLVLALAPTLWQMATLPPRDAATAALERASPWALPPLPDRAVRVAGLSLPGATLGDARAAWGDELQIALMATRGQPAVLEATVESARFGPVNGRLLFTARADAQSLQRWRDQAAKEAPVSADTRRIALRAQDRDDALRSPIVGIGFIPAAQLDADTLRQRFGEPSEKFGAGEPVEHWLYPERGLAIVLDHKGRELLQYVALADFDERLRLPLLHALQPPKP
jgi:hypothetical protein